VKSFFSNICKVRRFLKTSVGNPWLRHSSHPQENEKGPKKTKKSQDEMMKLSETNYSSCTGRSSENICSSSGGAQGERKDSMKLSLLPKLVENLVWVPVISLCKVFHSQLWGLMPFYAEIDRSHPSLIVELLK
jgi:hypothetical protein